MILATRYPKSEYVLRQEALAAEREVEFLRAHGVREYKNSHWNVMRLLRSAGADRETCKDVADWIGVYGALDGPFDHGRIFGRDGVPTILVGHPYQLTIADQVLIRAIRSMGFFVGVNGRSFYGFGTLQVLVTRRD